MRIRKAKMNDAPDIAAAHVLGWKYAYRGIVPDDYLNNLSIDERIEIWRKNISEARSNAYVAEIDEQVIGFSGYGPSRDDDTDEGTAEAYGIYVKPDFIGRGTSFWFWKKIKADMLQDGYNSCILWVFEKNEEAIRFYKKAGFDRDYGVERMYEKPSFSLKTVRYRWKKEMVS